jgi:hypothetical protein
MRFLVCLLALLIISCGEEPVSPAEARTALALSYNNRIVSYYDSAKVVRALVSTAVGEGKAGEVRKALDSLQTVIGRFGDSLRRLPDFEGDSTLRVAMQRLLLAYSGDAKKARLVLPIVFTEDAVDTLRFPDTLAPLDDSTDIHASLIPQYERVFRKNKETTAAIAEFRQAQATFAKRFGFKVAAKAAYPANDPE